MKPIVTEDFIPFTTYREFVEVDPFTEIFFPFEALPSPGSPTPFPFTSVLDEAVITKISSVVADANDLTQFVQNGQVYTLPTLAQLVGWTMTIRNENEQMVLDAIPLGCIATAAALNNNPLGTDFRMNCGKSFITQRPGAVVQPSLPTCILLLFHYRK